MIKNSSLGMQFRTCEKFWESTDSKSSFIPKFFTNTKAIPQILELDSSESNDSSLRENERSEFSWQSTHFCDSKNNKNQIARSATESRPIRGAKNRIQGRSSASADFLLESELRGSPPKSEKRQLLARRGSGAGGAALLRKEKGNSQIAKIDCHESLRDSRNDNIFLDSSLRATRYAQNDDRVDCHDSTPCVESRNDSIYLRITRDSTQITHKSTTFKANLI